MKRIVAILILLAVVIPAARTAPQQDWIRTGTGLGVERIRLAVADFKAGNQDPQTAELLRAFNETLFNDLENAGIFDMVSKSFNPLTPPGTPQEINLGAWSNPPPNANMVAFGNLGVGGGNVAVQGWLFEVKNPTSPQVLGKQYSEPATVENARTIAHRFANEIIFRLGGGIQGITESKIVFISNRSGNKEVWIMDYDGANQRQLSAQRSIALSPRISPDGSRVAFSSYARGGPHIAMYSLELGRMVSFPAYAGTNASPAWSPDGARPPHCQPRH
jgi:TolB protein